MATTRDVFLSILAAAGKIQTLMESEETRPHIEAQLGDLKQADDILWGIVNYATDPITEEPGRHSVVIPIRTT